MRVLLGAFGDPGHAFRDAGVETLIVSPMAFDAEERQRQLRLVAELNDELN